MYLYSILKYNTHNVYKIIIYSEDCLIVKFKILKKICKILIINVNQAEKKMKTKNV